MFRRMVGVVLAIAIIGGGTAMAGRVWVTTPIDPDGLLDAEYCALAMRSGNTWPVIAYGGGASADGTAVMTPVGWAAGPVNVASESIDAAVSPNGTAGFAGSDGRVVMLGQQGWSVSDYGGRAGNDVGYRVRASLAFNSSSVPSVLHNDYQGAQSNRLTLALFNGYGWYQDRVSGDDPCNPGTEIDIYTAGPMAMDFDSHDQANITFRRGDGLWYGYKGVLTQNNWLFSILPDTGGSPTDVDMALGLGDVPYVLYGDGSDLNWAIYDRQSASWAAGTLGSLYGDSGHFSVTSDSLGGVGVAYVSAADELCYAYNDGSSG